MLRALILLLLLANGLLLAANLGLFEGLAGPGKDREPERQSREINPGGLRVAPVVGAPGAAQAGAAGMLAAPNPPGVAGLPPVLVPTSPEGAAPASAPTSPASPPAATPAAMPASGAVAGACLQTGPVVGEQLARLERDLRAAGLPEGSWRNSPWPGGGGYLIVMGRYPDQATLVRKQNELRRRKVEWTELQAAPNLPAEFTPGLSLGRFDTEAAADAALARLESRGVRTARVEALPTVPGQMLLRLPSVDAAMQTRLARVPPPANSSWAACPTTPDAKRG